MAHVAINFTLKHSELSKSWWETSNYLACLSVQDEASLILLSQKLTSKNIKHEVFREPDINDQVTAIAVEPTEDARRACSNIPLAMRSSKNEGLNKNNMQEHDYSRIH